MVHQKLDISVYREANETIVVLTGEIDLHTAPRLSAAVDAALVEDPVRVVLDMRGVTFCDSRGLGTLVILARAAARSRAVLVLANLGDFLKRLLAVSGIGEHFVIREPDPEPADGPTLGLSDVEETGTDSGQTLGRPDPAQEPPR
ncbi:MULTISPECIES: STAS domain-containing protein [Actinomycetes]|uniref:Anti-sigma factor antagonist n=3 Tax=Actinomycetes TaxID=1760 RepID=A0A9X3PQT1_9ACTN|nr:STAS domain-containing protein [Glycomyces lechevalierae]MDA1388324.1 STAS domain-containing protein [Glycomyces lechevalierae]MDR7338721.1 anti-anti-sigma factor [Glycomyces lechevalierae]